VSLIKVQSSEEVMAANVAACARQVRSASRNGVKVVHQLQPLGDARWDEFLGRHPRASVFHSPAWLDALHRTYGYEPIVMTTSAPGADLQNGVVYCRVNSWLTGRRLVSLPFSDHCEPLVDDEAGLQAVFSALEQELRQEKLLYIEVRPTRTLVGTTSLFHAEYAYCFHQLDLRPDLDTLLRNCHKDSTQRKIRRAEREGLGYEDGRSEALLDTFYGLLLLTRRRHQLPPQPKIWFQNLIACFGDALKIRVAFKGRQAVASILTLRHKDTLLYKYGCSDAQFNNLGGTHLLFWRSIEEAKREGLRTLDLGRSDCENQGLITFKDRWGAARSVLTYSRFSSVQSNARFLPAGDWKERSARLLLSHLPDSILHSVGDLMYKHIG
jgi:CelD/BcsL family acetyltransferase involved in cellulose biosynthesis